MSARTDGADGMRTAETDRRFLAEAVTDPPLATETERVYLALKRQILTRRLRGGAPLRQVDLARQLGTSRTPVREAVIRLASESLVELLPHRSARVADLSLTDFLEVNQLRWVLEGYAAGVAAQHVTAAEIAEARAFLDGLGNPTDPDRLAEADQYVHELIAVHCRNERMARYIRQLNGMMMVARRLDIGQRGREMADNLRAIVDALQQRDGGEAERLMQEHINAFAARIPFVVRTAEMKGEAYAP